MRVDGTLIHVCDKDVDVIVKCRRINMYYVNGLNLTAFVISYDVEVNK